MHFQSDRFMSVQTDRRNPCARSFPRSSLICFKSDLIAVTRSRGCGIMGKRDRAISHVDNFQGVSVAETRASNPWERNAARVTSRSRRERREIGCISNKSREDGLDYEELYGRVIFRSFPVTRQSEKFFTGCRSVHRARSRKIGIASGFRNGSR